MATFPRRRALRAILPALLLLGLALAPQAAAHDCEDVVPGDCGDCPSGDHRHVLPGGLLYRCTSDSRPSGCPTPISPLIEYPGQDCLSVTEVFA